MSDDARTSRLARTTLDDKYAADRGRIFLTGIQALVRLLLVQSRLDRARGWNTAGFVSGYRGSPLGGLDQHLWAAGETLRAHRIHFEPGLNEDLAATAVWGSQQVTLFPGARHEGVFGMWYGKAPGLDRSCDALRHANAAGTAPRGGVLAVVGDDPACKSSTLPSQSGLALQDLEIPVLAPADVGEVLAYGLHGWALSRFAGSWVGLLALADTMDSAASVDADSFGFAPVLPEGVALPPGGLHIRRGDTPHAQEERVRRFRLPAALAYARANRLDRVVMDSPRPRLGIVASGRAYLSVRQALDDLGIDADAAERLGLRLLKVAMPWPLDRETLREFADGLEQVLVVETKRPLLETQIRDALYGLPDGRRPRVVGKRDERGAPLVSELGDLDAAEVAEAIASRLPADAPPSVERHLAQLHARAHAAPLEIATRPPWFCSGCPHNTSTRLPEGSRAMAGIGCHYMVQWMDRETDLFTQMGGEGVPWLGQAPFTDEPHVFANLGDGTYVHSGSLAVRAAVAAGANVTFKLLYNGAVAMTGGQPAEGLPSVPRIAAQLAAEGVAGIAVVAEDPSAYPRDTVWPEGTRVHPRRELDAVQRALRETPGTTVLIYDQACAAETRRKRRRGLAPEPPRRVFINEAVCEGCGDCSVQSNCLSVVPVETELGRKRRIDQSSCNKDWSCLEGSCPAFVTVEGAAPRRREPAALDALLRALPDRAAPPAPFDGVANVLVTGVGGTGVTTLAALLGMAAHLDGLECATLDMTGLAQKGGAVLSHVRLGPPGARPHGPRIPAASADVLLACDEVVAASPEVQELLDPSRTRGVANSDVAPTAEQLRDADHPLDGEALLRALVAATRECAPFEASAAARALLGDAIAANLLMLGFAWQRGWIPVSEAALLRAVELNGVAVEANRRAFALGRLAAVDAKRVRDLLRGAEAESAPPRTLDDLVRRRAEMLTDYQDAAYGERYRALVERVRAREADRCGGSRGLAEAVARGYHRLLAYKDEYEVARLYTDGSFRRALEREFEGRLRVRYHLAPPLFARRDPRTGRLRKRAWGRAALPLFHLLRRLRFLRGTWLDVFLLVPERRRERALIAEYEAVVEELLAGLGPENHELAVEIASLPMAMRGYDVVKMRNVEAARAREAELLAAYRASRADAA